MTDPFLLGRRRRRAGNGSLMFAYGAGVDPRTIGATYTGASVKTYLDASGTVQYAPMNLVVQSEGLGTASWTDIVAGGTATDGADTTTSISLTSLNDTSAVAEYVRGQTVGGLVGDGVKAFSLYIKKGTATTSVIALRDVTGSAWKLAAEITWSGTVPSVNTSLGGGAGTFVSSTSIGSGVYRLTFLTASVTAASTHSIRIYAADTWVGDASMTGTVLIGGVQVENNPVNTAYQKTTTTAVYAPRYAHYDPTQGGPTLLLEGSRTNTCLRSSEIGNAAWADIGVPVIASDVAVAPDGTTTADTIQDNEAAAVSGRSQAITIANDSTSWTYSHFVKKTSGATVYPCMRMTLAGGATPKDIIVVFNTDTGAVSASSGSPTTFVQSVGNYWRFGIATANNTTGNTTATPRFHPAWNTDGTITASNAAVGTQTVWGAMLENGAFPSSYIPTTSAAVTRAADALSFPFAPTPQAMTVYADQVDYGTLNTVNLRYLEISNSAAGVPAFFMRAVSSVAQIAHHNGATQVTSSQGAGDAFGDRLELSATLTATGVVQSSQAINSAAATASVASGTNTLSSAWAAPTRLTIGAAGDGSLSGFLALRSLKVAAGVQTMATMRVA